MNEEEGARLLVTVWALGGLSLAQGEVHGIKAALPQPPEPVPPAPAAQAPVPPMPPVPVIPAEPRHGRPAGAGAAEDRAGLPPPRRVELDSGTLPLRGPRRLRGGTDPEACGGPAGRRAAPPPGPQVPAEGQEPPGPGPHGRGHPPAGAGREDRSGLRERLRALAAAGQAPPVQPRLVQPRHRGPPGGLAAPPQVGRALGRHGRDLPPEELPGQCPRLLPQGAGPGPVHSPFRRTSI